MQSITENIKRFSTSYEIDYNKRHSSQLPSYQLLVNDIPQLIRNHLNLSVGYKIKGSIGTGVNTGYPWISIFDERITNSAQTGFYIVLLFSDDFRYVFLTLNQGATQQKDQTILKIKRFIYNLRSTPEGFLQGELPKGSLVRRLKAPAHNNGVRYELSDIYYKRYRVSDLNEDEFLKDLNNLLRFYKYAADVYVKTIDLSEKDSDAIPNLIINKSASKFNREGLITSLKGGGLYYLEAVITRLIASIITKPFVILTGLSGSGKTKLAQAFAMWICETDSQYVIVPVGADWTNREPLLGFPNSLEKNGYVKPDNGVLDLILEASKEENKDNPYFLILDEMNLSHVERYFADFLSVMESNGSILLHSGQSDLWDGVPSRISFPKNLFIIGTVNIDETTYMFSPKVLDRASVIEFRVTSDEMQDYLANYVPVNMSALEAQGASMATDFVALAKNKELTTDNADEIAGALLEFFNELKKAGAEFGYRSASEILRYAAVVNTIEKEWNTNQIVDTAIMQKLLPKVHGSTRKLKPVLETLGALCLENGKDIEKVLENKNELSPDVTGVKYPVSLEKIKRMYDNLMSNGFTSYAEA